MYIRVHLNKEYARGQGIAPSEIYEVDECELSAVARRYVAEHRDEYDEVVVVKWLNLLYSRPYASELRLTYIPTKEQAVQLLEACARRYYEIAAKLG